MRFGHGSPVVCCSLAPFPDESRCPVLPGAGILQSALTPGKPSSCNPSHPPHPPPTCPGAHDGPKAKKAKKAPSHGIFHAMGHGRYRAAPLPRHCAVSYSHMVAKMKDPSSLTRASHPVFPSHPIASVWHIWVPRSEPGILVRSRGARSLM